MQLDSYLDEFDRRDWQTVDEGDVRLALVGLGGFTRSHVLPALSETDFCDVTVLVSGSPGDAEALAAERGVERVLDYDAFERGDAVDAYDAVYVATPNGTHLEYGAIAAAHGKDVICEKPLEATAERGRRLVERCDDAGVTLMVAYRPQADPVHRRLRELLRDGVIGDPVQIHAGFSFDFVGSDPDPDRWRFDPDLAGGGALLDVGVYPLNASRFLLEAEPIAVSAAVDRWDGHAIDEHVAFQVTFPDATASCTASYGAHPANRLQIVGTEGQVVVEQAFDAGATPRLTIERGETRVEHVGPTVNEVAEEFDYFAHCLLADATPEPDGRDGLADLAVCEAIYESAERGRRIDLDG